MNTSAKKVATYAAKMTPERRRIFTKLVALADVPTGQTIREQFHCSRATAEAVATAIADYRMTPAERRFKAKADAAAKASPQGTGRRYFKPRTFPGGGVYKAFTEEAMEQCERDFPRGGGVWSDKQGKWISSAESRAEAMEPSSKVEAVA